MIHSKVRMVGLLVVLSTVCGYVGIAVGSPNVFGPCNTDATNTCAFTCIPDQTNDPPISWLAATDQTKVPYCGNTNQTACSPIGSAYACTWLRFNNPTCMGQGANFQNLTKGCP